MSLLLSCGGSQVDVEVGEKKIDREALIKWNEERTGGGSDMSTLIETVNEWIPVSYTHLTLPTTPYV